MCFEVPTVVKQEEVRVMTRSNEGISTSST